MLNIKDAGRYANYLKGIISQVENLMYYNTNFLKTTETHLKSKANPDAVDETVTNEVERIFTGQIQDMAFLVRDLINHKLQLALAIEAAKKDLTIEWKEEGVNLTLDTAIEYNKNLREMAKSYLSRLTNLKSTVGKTTARAFKINVEGNQVPYTYDVETKTELDFDKDIIKDLYKKTLDKTDKISILIDQAELKEIVDFTPKYDLHDSLEDVIAAFENSKEAK